MNELLREKVRALKVGDEVTRMLAGTIPQKLKVTEVNEDTIVCALWTFDRNTGFEIDEDIPVLVSFLKMEGVNYEVKMD